jgi:DNA-binding NarL/FixJ family response regulator
MENVYIGIACSKIWREWVLGTCRSISGWNVAGCWSSIDEMKQETRHRIPDVLITDCALATSLAIEFISRYHDLLRSAEVLVIVHNDSLATFDVLASGATTIVPHNKLSHFSNSVYAALNGEISLQYADFCESYRLQKQLTPDRLLREDLSLLRLLHSGAGDRHIGSHLGIAESAAKNNVKSLLDRLNTKSRMAAVGLSRRMGIHASISENDAEVIFGSRASWCL